MTFANVQSKISSICTNSENMQRMTKMFLNFKILKMFLRIQDPKIPVFARSESTFSWLKEDSPIVTWDRVYHYHHIWYWLDPTPTPDQLFIYKSNTS